MHIESADAMKNYGKDFAKTLKKGDVVLLSGPLGAGKTTFVQGLGEGLGIKEFINSPTFTFIQSYVGDDIKLHHMDMYRIMNEEEAYDLGLEEFFYSDDISVVEWPEQISSFLPDHALVVSISKEGEGRGLTIGALKDGLIKGGNI